MLTNTAQTKLDVTMERTMRGIAVVAAVMTIVGFYGIAVHIFWTLIPGGKYFIGLATAVIAHLALVGFILARRS